jgi:hypothetical protein
MHKENIQTSFFIVITQSVVSCHLVLQELTAVLVTLLPLASVNNSRYEHYVSKGFKVGV